MKFGDGCLNHPNSYRKRHVRIRVLIDLETQLKPTNGRGGTRAEARDYMPDRNVVARGGKVRADFSSHDPCADRT